MHFRPVLLTLLLSLSATNAVIAADQVPVATREAPAFERYTQAAGELVDQAMSYLGIRYRFGGTSPETGLDCSGLVLNVFRNAIGLDLPRTAAEMSRVGENISRQELKPGDLVFFNTMRRAFSHVGIYLGDGQFVHAPSSGGKVRIENLGNSYWAARFNGARRLVDDNDSPPAGLMLAR
ncbi:C40 family peptidase [Thauera sp. 2A1]|uniref:C40 family peptidase n=1 Tax=Thauera sp. 2A1 TaxID=2570191 RepID=UPI001292B25C|nr:C40 family peptidase [Thauera sp. 2A1]KAI5914344.1 C40 family peptidase [Thauera sp. 2A1]MBS0555622.1 C40 family peptidase [Pseudomonadota bacterium]